MPTYSDEQLRQVQENNSSKKVKVPEKVNIPKEKESKPEKTGLLIEPKPFQMTKWDNSDLPCRYRRYTLADFAKDAEQTTKAFLFDPEWCLYLCGGVGTKKTSLACAILKEFRKNMPPPDDRPGLLGGIFLPMYRAAAMLRDFTAGAMHTWQQTPWLILDDVGSNRATAHVTEQLLFLLEHRYDHERKTIITTNLTLDEFSQTVDERAASRIQEGYVLNLGNTDNWHKEKE